MDTNFIVRNGLSVNSAFTVNSSSLSYISNVATIGTSLYVVSNGNVGIGNSVPAHKLVVDGTSRFRNNITISTTAGINANGSLGTQGQALLSNGTSVYWATATAGSDTQVQFNDASTANASAGFTFTKTTNNVSIANSLNLGNNLTVGNLITGNTLTISTNTVTFGTTSYFVSNGNLGVGNSAPAAKLHVQGDVVVSGDITSSYSDDRLKSRISNISEALEKVKQLSGFIYVPSDLGIAVGITDGASLERKVGVSAQEVQKVLPEAVKPSVLNPEYLTVQYEKIIPLLIEAIKELEAKVACTNCSCGGK